MEVARGERREERGERREERELRVEREERKARCGEWCGDSIKPFKVTDNAGPVKWGDGRYLFMGVSSQSAVSQQYSCLCCDLHSPVPSIDVVPPGSALSPPHPL